LVSPVPDAHFEHAMNPPITDWTHLPPDSNPLSLWECLHDAKIQTLRSDRVACTLSVELDIFYIRRHHGLPDDLRFLLRFEGVSSVRANVFAVWPGELFLPPGASPEERNRAIGEVQAKSREQSVSWDTLETAWKRQPNVTAINRRGTARALTTEVTEVHRGKI
jgi:hypothetical protein